MNEERKITSVEEYRNENKRIKILTLPSGSMFQIKRLTVYDYISEGIEDIPNDFLAFISELGAGKDISNSDESKKNIELFEKYLRITIEKGVVSPPVVLKYDKEKKKTHLIYAELSNEDQMALLDAIIGKTRI